MAKVLKMEYDRVNVGYYDTASILFWLKFTQFYIFSPNVWNEKVVKVKVKSVYSMGMSSTFDKSFQYLFRSL